MALRPCGRRAAGNGSGMNALMWQSRDLVMISSETVVKESSWNPAKQRLRDKGQARSLPHHFYPQKLFSTLMIRYAHSQLTKAAQRHKTCSQNTQQPHAFSTTKISARTPALKFAPLQQQPTITNTSARWFGWAASDNDATHNIRRYM